MSRIIQTNMETLAARAAPAAAAVRRTGDYSLNLFASTAIVLLITFIFILSDPRSLHWFALPTALCGIISGIDIIRWLRREIDVFDPKAIIAILGFNMFFLTPFLHIIWNMYGGAHVFGELLEGDWRPWFGLLSIYNVVALICLRGCQRWAFKKTKPAMKVWEVNPGRFSPIMIAAIIISLIAEATLLVVLGGLGAMAPRLGLLLAFAHPLFILIGAWVAYLLRDTTGQRRGSWFKIGLFLLPIAALQFLMVGLYGSRSAWITQVICVVVAFHLLVKRITVKTVLLALGVLILFLTIYGFYKRFGTEAIEIMQEKGGFEYLSEKEGGFKGTVLGDLSRAAPQAYILYKLKTYPEAYRYWWGKTYLIGIGVVIPRAIWPDRPPGKVEAGTQALFAPAPMPKLGYSSRVYALGGEAILNFGPLGIPVMFSIYGLIMGYARKKFSTLTPFDGRRLLVGMLTVTLASGFFSDLDNTVFGFLKNGALLTLCLFLTCNRIRRTEATQTS